MATNVTPIYANPTWTTSTSVPSYTVSTGTGVWNSGAGGVTINPNAWTTSNTYTISTPNPSMTVGQSGKIELKGDEADLAINGKSLKSWMEKVEQRLNILTVNPELEADWDELRKLGEKYRTLEKRCLEKADVWNKLKAMPETKP